MGGEEPEKTEDVEMPTQEEEPQEEVKTETEVEDKPAEVVEPEPEPDPAQEYEEQFKDRFTEKDELYTTTISAAPIPPPVITNWSKGGHDRYGKRDDRDSRDDRSRKGTPESKIPGYYQFIY